MNIRLPREITRDNPQRFHLYEPQHLIQSGYYKLEASYTYHLLQLKFIFFLIGLNNIIAEMSEYLLNIFFHFTHELFNN